MKVKVEDLKVSHQIVGIYGKCGELVSTGGLINNLLITYDLHDKGITIVRRMPRMEISLSFDSFVEVEDVRAF